VSTAVDSLTPDLQEKKKTSKPWVFAAYSQTILALISYETGSFHKPRQIVSSEDFSYFEVTDNPNSKPLKLK
jgi:hypothetical protein